MNLKIWKSKLDLKACKRYKIGRIEANHWQFEAKSRTLRHIRTYDAKNNTANMIGWFKVLKQRHKIIIFVRDKNPNWENTGFCLNPYCYIIWRKIYKLFHKAVITFQITRQHGLKRNRITRRLNGTFNGMRHTK